MNAPQIETKVTAKTSTATEQTVTDSEVENGWWIYGYRVKGRNAGRRQSMVPRLYFVEKER